MAFKLKVKESISDGIIRNVKTELEKALLALTDKVKPSERETWQSETVHDVRKSFKKVRAALRLLREEFGVERYRKENWCFRDAARPFTLVRDAQVLVEAFTQLRQEFNDQLDAGTITKIQDALLLNRQEVIERILNKGNAFSKVEEIVSRAIPRLSDWKLKRTGWDSLQSGLSRVYHQGHHAFSLAVKNPTMENLHEWRKQTKYHWHQLQLIESAWVTHEKDLADKAHDLARLLGGDHDLAVLKATLAADPLAYGGHRVLKEVFVFIDQKRGELEKQAFELGKQVYRETSKVFAARMEGYWKEWSGELGAKDLKHSQM